MKSNFYIGWQNDTPDRNKKALKALLIPLFILLPLLAGLIVRYETEFNDHQFELGTLREFQGIYFNSPRPVLLLDPTFVPEGYDREALLLGFGKFGADPTMKALEEKEGRFEGKRIRLRGTLLKGDGKILIELSEGKASLLNVERSITYPMRQTTPKAVALQGEIIDPKCWFGAMKPGEGKVHKSCAIRCISGGIPPVLRVKKNSGNIYYLLEGEGNENIHETFLEFVAEPITLQGEVYYQNGWNVVRTSAKKITYIHP